MARTPYTQNSYIGGAYAATLTGAINSSTSTISLTFAGTQYSSWTGLGIATSPSGATATAGFFLSIDYNTSAEEKVWVPAQTISWTTSPITLTGVVRGVDNTTAQSHAATASVIPILTATDLSEDNYTTSQTVGLIGAQGDLLYGATANSFARLGIGSAGQVLTAGTTGPYWATIGSNAHTSVTVADFGASAAVLVGTNATYTAGTTDQSGGLGIGAKITGNSTGTLTIDGVALGSTYTGTRVLIAGNTNTNSKYNGIYNLTTVGNTTTAYVLTRSADYNDSVAGEVAAGDFTTAVFGTTYNGKTFLMNATGSGTGGITIIGTDPITWV